MPSASVTTGPVGERAADVRRADRGLDADDPDVGQQRLHGDRHAGGESAAAERHDDARQVGEVVDELQAERALAGDHGGVVERVAERHAALAGPLRGRRRHASSSEAPPSTTSAP